jgi:hypothetical protein
VKRLKWTTAHQEDPVMIVAAILGVVLGLLVAGVLAWGLWLIVGKLSLLAEELHYVARVLQQGYHLFDDDEVDE